MCGIVGMVGEGVKIESLIEGLEKLEYRGYDSAGIAFPEKQRVNVHKTVGKIANLKEELAPFMKSTITAGIAHTRWATHGAPTGANAHPHTDCKGKIAVVHNGIIENHSELRKKLINSGHKFHSETDTEVIAHLVEEHYEGDLPSAIRHALVDLEGAYAIAVVHADNPDMIVAARKGSPLVVGFTESEAFLASDVTPLLKYIRDVYFIEDGDVVLLAPGKLEISRVDGSTVKRPVTHINWSEKSAEKGGFPHFMLKEIFEEPEVLRNALAGRIKNGKAHLPEMESVQSRIKSARNIQIVACGTSYHAGLVLKRFLEDHASISVEIDVASEFRYRNIHIDNSTVVIAISQSGETADTLEGIRKVKAQGGTVVAVTNVVGSTLARESDVVVYLNAGPEIGVAATKTYVSQLAVLYIIGAYFSQIRQDDDRVIQIINELEGMPTVFESTLSTINESIVQLAKEYYQYRHFMYIGRGYGYPTAMEGALKLKEISYIHASAYQAGELKHGPIALLDKEFPVFAIVPDDGLKAKVLSNIMETRARNARVVAICTEGDQEIGRIVNSRIEVPRVSEVLYPLVMSPYLQLFAYHAAVLRGNDPDKPRNLAKSVTVE
ncbi:glucosamine--fructose-6-phosphate aminotransferase [Kosmotoga arenicorallina S304]|uniref:Glutamine--fructose-6-phosphate aminotransferase [isomerizing] n=1 Tax=Kosmotoga arenicorallina S304 TaxID=1453497 RepID=A0A176K2R9_9BACT|nr:glutamine--fructose-6-phosphate transaminase (isomerizing) [Kosmotoga arenicorallina]OAA31328.1 glucosamine--fructose-6-phosphate aminotransferase [Kosmotoga arenicorallina S304]